MPQLDLILLEKLTLAVRDAIESAPLMGLGETPKCAKTQAAIKRLLSEQSAKFPPLTSCAISGLWLLAGELDRSHDISQILDSPTGSYWHGIMHRREGDFSNANYWMRRAAGHPVMAELANYIDVTARAGALASLAPQTSRTRIAHCLTEPDNLAASLIDLCKLAGDSQPELVSDLQLICWWEWQLLFQHSLPSKSIPCAK